MLGTRLIVWICLYCIQIDAARILAIFPMPAISHQVFFRPLTQELVKRGHEVTVVTPYPAYPKGQAPINLTEVDVYDASISFWNKIILNNKVKKGDLLSMLQKAITEFASMVEMQLQSYAVQEVLNKPKDYFDLLLLEACFITIIGIGNKFDAPIIQISSFGTTPGHYSFFGAPMHPLLYPTCLRQRVYNLTRWEKILEFFKYVAIEYYILPSNYEENLKVMRKLFGDMIPNDLGKRVKLLFLNEHRIWADNRPISSNVQFIGGIHQTPEKELPKDLKSYLDASKNGVIYVSFGTSVSTTLLASEKIVMMTRALSKLPYDVLMKWDDDELPGQPPNVRIQKWLPQSDILKHPKIILFITQAGLQSTDEAINAAVPLLGIPMHSDQWYNSEKYVHHKVGLQLNFETLNEIEFKNSIETIITDKSYKKNMLRLHKLMREYPIKPLDLFVWWTEHIIKYGGDHLLPPSANMSWMEYYEVELIIIGLGVILAVTSLLVLKIEVLLIIMKKILCFSRTKIKAKLEKKKF